jgi:hypothetical protein
MTENQPESHSPAARQPEAEHQEGPEHAVAQRRSPQFGYAEAQVVAAAQEEAVEQGLLPPGQDEARAGARSSQMAPGSGSGGAKE